MRKQRGFSLFLVYLLALGLAFVSCNINFYDGFHIDVGGIDVGGVDVDSVDVGGVNVGGVDVSDFEVGDVDAGGLGVDDNIGVTPDELIPPVGPDADTP